jgi:uncharacterized membrane protein
MNLHGTKRIESIDILRGVVMVLMALDHSRDYFIFGGFLNDPTNLEHTTRLLFFTRFITHFCAPVFVFLAGTSAFLYGEKTTKPVLSKFLFTRGLWLIFVEIVVMNFLWWFDLSYSFIGLNVIWAIGVSMIVLGIAIYLPRWVILIIGLLIITTHNLFDGFTMEGNSVASISWYVLHQTNYIDLSKNFGIGIGYPVLPWIGVILLGYCFGTFYSGTSDESTRKKWLLWLGLGSIGLFFILRGFNVYGDLTPWSVQKNKTYSVLSFFNLTKYPPSLDYLLLTLGPAFLFLYAIEKTKNRFTNFFLVFGRVPFFYYILHILFLHLLAMLVLIIVGGDWRDMLFKNDASFNQVLSHYGYQLWVVYVVWVGLIFIMYPLCKRYMIYKAKNKNKWWLSYL